MILKLGKVKKLLGVLQCAKTMAKDTCRLGDDSITKQRESFNLFIQMRFELRNVIGLKDRHFEYIA